MLLDPRKTEIVDLAVSKTRQTWELRKGTALQDSQTE